MSGRSDRTDDPPGTPPRQSTGSMDEIFSRSPDPAVYASTPPAYHNQYRPMPVPRRVHDDNPPTHLSTSERSASRISSSVEKALVRGRRALNFNSGRQPFFIGVAGGTASGKTTVCDSIMQRLSEQCAVLISQDSFYRGLTEEEMRNVKNYNFDHPSAFDEEAIIDTLTALREGRDVDVPVYDFSKHQRSDRTDKVQLADVVVIEGILVLHMKRIREMLNMKIFVDTDDDVRLARRIQRDVAERGRDVVGVIEQYTRFVKPAFDQFVAPSRRHADIIIPWARGDNYVAIDLIVQHIRSKIDMPYLQRVFPNLQIVPSNKQIRGMHTIIRDKETSRNDFIFYADRLIRLLVEAGLGLLPFKEKTVETPPGKPYTGVDFSRKLCAVSLIRSGEAMEQAVRACCKGIKIGKILIHRAACDMDSLETPPMVYEKLPADIADRHVLLLDPILATGNSADKAIDVLLSKGVPQDRLLFLTLICAPQGIAKICSKYPKVTVITTEIDEGVDERGLLVPGVGEFGDRYFCS